MKLIDEVIKKIDMHHRSKSSAVMAHALYSACHHGNFPGPNLLTVSCSLDNSNAELFFKLAKITSHADYSNDDQAEACLYIENKFSGQIDLWRNGIYIQPTASQFVEQT